MKLTSPGLACRFGPTNLDGGRKLLVSDECQRCPSLATSGDPSASRLCRASPGTVPRRGTVPWQRGRAGRSRRTGVRSGTPRLERSGGTTHDSPDGGAPPAPPRSRPGG